MMNPAQGHAAALGLPLGGTPHSPADIKAAFRLRAKACHPDLHPGNAAAAAEFARVSAAAEALLAHRGRPSPVDPFASGPAGARAPPSTSPARAAAVEAALRSRRFSLAFSGACLVGGIAIFAGALRVHTAVFGPDPVALEAAARREDPPEAVARFQEAVAAAVADRARQRDSERRGSGG